MIAGQERARDETTRRQCCLGLLAAFAAPILASCQTGSSQPSLVTHNKGRQLGEQGASEVARTTVGLVEDPGLVRYVNDLGRRLATEAASSNASYEFHIADDPQPNAFALPGGFVYITRGTPTLANSEDELAGVMGHEIGHSVAP